MVERKNEIEIVRNIATMLNCEPDEIISIVRKIKREISEIESEIKKLNSE